jgi:hypothetical protein
MNAAVAITPTSNESKKPLAKTRTVSARVTEEEYTALQKYAWTHAKTMGDWLRDCLLQRLQSGSGGQMEQHIFTELVGVQLLLMNTLGPLLRGERFTAEQLDAVLRQVQSAKAQEGARAPEQTPRAPRARSVRIPQSDRNLSPDHCLRFAGRVCMRARNPSRFPFGSLCSTW